MRHFLAYTDKETQEIIEERFFSDSNDSGSESGGEASPSGSEPESGAESEVESESEPSSWVADSDPGHQGCRSKRPRGGSSKKRTVERCVLLLFLAIFYPACRFKVCGGGGGQEEVS